MRLRVICHKKHRAMLKEMSTEVEEERVNDEDGKLELVFLCDPGKFREIDQLIKSTPNSQLHVLSSKEITEGDSTLD